MTVHELGGESDGESRLSLAHRIQNHKLLTKARGVHCEDWANWMWPSLVAELLHLSRSLQSRRRKELHVGCCSALCSRFSSCFVCRTREIQITSQAIWTIAHTGSVLIFSFMSTGSCLLVVVECCCVWWFWINWRFHWFTKVATWLLVSSPGDFMGTRLEESVTYKKAITTSETLNSCFVSATESCVINHRAKVMSWFKSEHNVQCLMITWLHIHPTYMSYSWFSSILLISNAPSLMNVTLIQDPNHFQEYNDRLQLSHQ